ncbi:probable serine/threonine-protein kinase kinX [Colossoma macropomum]|uniref:probable serine/threonine-protein kinase kinX n=1 Tax=Colossoma macropomum TaxID=42526 RepID=UPI001864A89D|nr:probable serine/threonine-protein kinase kinX [Colossoma macropomum]
MLEGVKIGLMIWERSEGAENEREAVDESAAQGGFGDIAEVSVEKKPTDDQDSNDERTSQLADDWVFQLTSSAREQGDLLNKELKVDETTENKATATPEREVIDVNNVGTKQGAVGTVKDGQHEAGQQLTETETAEVCESQLDEEQINFTEEIVQTTHELLEETVTGQIENTETYEKEPESISKIIEKKTQPAPERQPIDNIEEREARQQLDESKTAETLGISESKLDEDQTEGIETAYKLLEGPVTEQTENAEVYEEEPEPISRIIEKKAPERDVIIEEPKQETVGTAQDGQQFSESKAFDIFESKLDEAQIEFTEGIVETKHEPLEEPVTGQIEHVEVYEEEPEPVSKITEKKAVSTPEREKINEGTKQVAADGQHEAGQQVSEFIASEIADKLNLQKSKLDEAQIEFTEGIVETKHEPLEEPVIGQIEHIEVYEKEPEPTPEREAIIEEPKQGTVGTAPDEAGQQFSEYKPAEIVDVCDSKLEEFTEEIVETECELLEEPVTEQMDNAEAFGQDLEPITKRIENKATPTPEREAIDAGNEKTKQETVGPVKDGQYEAGQQFSESKAFDIFESKLDEAQIEFTEEIVETKREPLEEPVTGQIEHVEVYEEEPEPVSKMNENKAPEREMIEVIDEGTKQVAADGQHEAGQQLSEFIASEIADKLDIHEPKLDEAQIEFTEEIVETKHEPLEETVTGQIEHVEVYEKEPEPTPEREAIIEEPKQGTVGTAPDEAGQQFSESKPAEIVDVRDSKLEEFTEEIAETECELLEEAVTEQMDNAEAFGQDLEPISKRTENKATPTPEREAIDAGNEKTKQETVGTVKDGQYEAGQQFSESKAFDIFESKLDEAQIEFTEEIVETKREPMEEPVTGQIEHVEVYEEEPEPVSKMNENKAPEREMIEVIDEGTKQVAADGQHEAGQQLSEFIASEIADKLDIHEPKLDEAQIEFTEEIVETKHEPLEEPVIGQIEHIEVYEEEIIEKKAPERDVIIEEPKQETVGTAQDEAGQQFSESKAFDIFESKLDEAQIEFTEEIVETKHEPLEGTCDRTD